MKINNSGATFSSIVGIGQKISKTEKETGDTFLPLNRGVNNVCLIDLQNIVDNIPYNSKEIQHYAPNLGIEKLRRSIVEEYYLQDYNDVCITPGGMSSLDLIIQILNVTDVKMHKFYWGSYSKMCTIRNKSFSFYDNLYTLDFNNLNSDTAIIICEPSNPTGLQDYDDKELLDIIKKINETGAIIIFDSPYRMLFDNSTYIYDVLSSLDNVIICESFSKHIGLSGIRLGFIYCNNKEFNQELNIRVLYQFNGISTIPQLLVNELLTTEEGYRVIKNFRDETVKHIQLNIEYLKENNLLAEEIYGDKLPIGIFAIVNKTEEFLFQNKIGSVGLEKFTFHDKDYWNKYSRICVSVPHDTFKEFFNKIIKC